MKTREGSVPDLVRATREDGGDDASDERSRPPRNALKTAEIDVTRDRRSTLTSPIPAMLAESMSDIVDLNRDPAAPTLEEAELTRKVGESDKQPLTKSGPLARDDAGFASRRHRAAQRIDDARAALDPGDVTAAVTSAEEALREGEEAPPPGIVEVIEPARPLLTRVFATYVGPLNGVPVLAPRAQEIARTRLGESERALIARIDGLRTLEELFDGSGFGSTDALRIAARLLRTGAIRII